MRIDFSPQAKVKSQHIRSRLFVCVDYIKTMAA